MLPSTLSAKQIFIRLITGGALQGGVCPWLGLRSRRVSFVAAVAYAAAVLQPLPVGMPATSFRPESRRARRPVREPLAKPPSRACSRLNRLHHRSRDRPRDRHRAVLGGQRRPRVEFLHSFILIVLPYLGLVLGASMENGWAGAPGSLFRATGPQRRYRFSIPASIIDGRIAERLRQRVQSTHAGDSTVRAEGAAARRRFRRFAQAEPRPRGLDILQKIQKMSGVEVSISDLIFRTCAKSISS